VAAHSCFSDPKPTVELYDADSKVFVYVSATYGGRERGMRVREEKRGGEDLNELSVQDAFVGETGFLLQCAHPFPSLYQHFCRSCLLKETAEDGSCRCNFPCPQCWGRHLLRRLSCDLGRRALVSGSFHLQKPEVWYSSPSSLSSTTTFQVRQVSDLVCSERIG